MENSTNDERIYEAATWISGGVERMSIEVVEVIVQVKTSRKAVISETGGHHDEIGFSRCAGD